MPNITDKLKKKKKHWLGIGKMHYFQHQLQTASYTRKLVYELITKTIKPITAISGTLQMTNSQI